MSRSWRITPRPTAPVVCDGCVGSVAQRNAGDLAPQTAAADAAPAVCSGEPVIERYGRYVTAVEVTAGAPGDLAVADDGVRVRWQVPNFFARPVGRQARRTQVPCASSAAH